MRNKIFIFLLLITVSLSTYVAYNFISSGSFMTEDNEKIIEKEKVIEREYKTEEENQKYDNLSNQPDDYIATYGKLPEFDSEEERQNWLAKLDEIGDRIRTKGKLSPYFYPNGSVITYGHDYQGYFIVSFEKGSGVDKSLMDEIYRIIDKEARELGIREVPVLFRLESFPELD